jgi:hypothetical protein
VNVCERERKIDRQIDRGKDGERESKGIRDIRFCVCEGSLRSVHNFFACERYKSVIKKKNNCQLQFYGLAFFFQFHHISESQMYLVIIICNFAFLTTNAVINISYHQRTT